MAHGSTARMPMNFTKVHHLAIKKRQARFPGSLVSQGRHCWKACEFVYGSENNCANLDTMSWKLTSIVLKVGADKVCHWPVSSK
jgi:hypothetical protein